MDRFQGEIKSQSDKSESIRNITNNMYMIIIGLHNDLFFYLIVAHNIWKRKKVYNFFSFISIMRKRRVGNLDCSYLSSSMLQG